MFNAKQLRELIIAPTLKDLQLYSENAVELLMFTCANESEGGTYVHQVNGPALGIFQIEPRTYSDIWANYIPIHLGIVRILANVFDCVSIPDPMRMIYDLRFATAMARLFYARIKEPLPDCHDVDAIWQ